MQTVSGYSTAERSQHTRPMELHGELVAANDTELPGICHSLARFAVLKAL
jgi:hypothetical protein